METVFGPDPHTKYSQPIDSTAWNRDRRQSTERRQTSQLNSPSEGVEDLWNIPREIVRWDHPSKLMRELMSAISYRVALY
jgi:hypothetical protein